MEQIFPSPVDDVDVHAVYAADDRPSWTTRPWVLCNMISSLDGAIAIDGVSGGLGGPGDKAVFSAIRAVADVIIVGAGTVIAENYRRSQASPEVQQLRARRGQSPLPQIAIVSASLGIDPSHRVFDPESRPLVITHEQSPDDARAQLSTVADVRVVGTNTVDLTAALTMLKSNGANCVLLEGGPTLNGAFVDADLVDEWCLTSSPTIVGGTGARAVGSSRSGAVRRFRLDRSLHDDGYLFHRYVRS